MDEIHLLGSDRGHVLEMIVTRMRKLAGESVRMVGLSTAMANATDLTEWLNNCDLKQLRTLKCSILDRQFDRFHFKFT